MKISRVVVKIVNLDRANAVFVEIYTDDGFVGIGETVLSRWDRTVAASIEEMSQWLIGQDPRHTELLHERLYRDSFFVGGPLHGAGRSAVDIALWDIKAQALGVPVYELLGGPTRASIPVYCHCPAGESPESFVANIKECVERGYVGAKTTLPVFYGSAGSGDGVSYSGVPGRISPTQNETEYLPTAVISEISEYFAAAREAVGHDIELMLDCHGRLNTATAIQLAEALEPYKLLFIEEPIPPESPQDLARVTASTSLRIASGERLATSYEVRPYLEDRAIDVLQCDIVTCGGFTGMKKIASLAEAHYVPLAPHNPNGPVATLASIHLLAAIPNAFMLETVGSQADVERASAIVDRPPLVKGGQFEVPTDPGLGASLLPDIEDHFPARAVFRTR